MVFFLWYFRYGEGIVQTTNREGSENYSSKKIL